MIRNRLFCLLFTGALCLPLLQRATGLLPTRPLGGVEAPPPPPPAPGLAGWHAGALQEHWDRDFERQLGLRDWLVRADNQVRYSVFGRAKGDVTAGADDWLYPSEYLPGRDVGNADRQRALLVRLANLRRLQDVLAQHGIAMLVVVSPNKARLLPERLPPHARAALTAAGPSYYEFAADWLRDSGLHWFDGHALFARWHAQGVDFPLFTPGGAHWSAFASAKVAGLVLDELLRLGVPVRSFDVARGETSAAPQADENDLVAMANLLDERAWATGTPVPRLQPRGDAPPLRLLIEGTSFVWGLLNRWNEGPVASPATFLYYLNTRHDFVDGRALPPRRHDWAPDDLARLRAEVLSYRALLIEANELMLPELGHGLAEGLLLLLGEAPLAATTPELEDYRVRHAGRR